MSGLFGEESVLEDLKKRLNELKRYDFKRSCNLYLVAAVIMLFFAFCAALVFAVKFYLQQRDKYDGFLFEDEIEEEEEDDGEDDADERPAEE